MTRKACWRAKPIFLKLGKWLKSRKSTYFLGKEIDLELDLKAIGGVKGPNTSKINTFARWDNQTGSLIKDSKTRQDDTGNTTTAADYNGSLFDRTENTLANEQADAVKEVVVRKGGGTPAFRWTRKEEQTWTASVKATDNYFSIAGSNTQDPTQKGEFLTISPKGAVLKPKQPKALALFETRINNVTGDKFIYALGTREKWHVIYDDDNCFHPGGDGKRLSYTTKYPGVYVITIQLTYFVVTLAGIISIRIINKLE